MKEVAVSHNSVIRSRAYTIRHVIHRTFSFSRLLKSLSSIVYPAIYIVSYSLN